MTGADESVFSECDLNDLQAAKTRLEHPSLTAKLADLVGGPIDAGLKHLPIKWNERLGNATETALYKGLEFSVRTMGSTDSRPSRDWLHKLVVVGSGVAAGTVGFYSLIVELPFSTCVILRSIADIARSEGHDISLVEVKLECLEVLAYGGRTSGDDSVETSYWMVRGALAKSVSEAASHLTQKGLTKEGAPVLARLISAIASRFSAVVTEEAAAKAMPVIGAISGGTINYLFMNHFQEMARGDFIVRRLEKKYGTARVEQTYRDLVI